jgi:phosphoglycerate dehydrogenase-like enzyme
MSTARPFTVTFPDADLAASQQPAPDGVRFLVADIRSEEWEAAAGQTDMLVLPYMSRADVLTRLAGSSVSVVQSQSVGFDGAAESLPSGIAFCNAGGVHEEATGELALTLILASLRGVPDAVLNQSKGTWHHVRHPGLADKRVLIVGAGGVSTETYRRLMPFNVKITRVARSARVDALGAVESLESLPALLAEADVVVLAVPLSAETTGMVDSAFLAAMPADSLLVNVSRGAIVNTDDLVAELQTGRIMAALDVTDPEPLPAAHALWFTPRTLITPHVGGDTGAMAPRISSLLKRQIAGLARGEKPVNQVL